MKSKLVFPIVFLLFVFITSCQKQGDESSESQNLIVSSEKSAGRQAVAVELDREVYNQMVAVNEARLALLNSDASRAGCVQTAIVPDDYATIQEAMDAVCKNGTIIVNDGTYKENVLIDKQGLSIEGIGNVIVIGSFYLYSNADNVKIQNFKIKPVGNSSFNGIYGYGIQGGEIKQNTIIGVRKNGYGIVLENSNDISIKQNQVSDFEWGIVFISVDGIRLSNKNIIQDNTITGITYASCIGLEGDCNLNLIKSNLITKNSNIANAGIYLGSDISGAYLPDHNVLEYNTVTKNSYTGIWIVSGSNNTIGPNNICNNSKTDIGIYLSYNVNKTNVFNNTALKNKVCDIVYEEGADINFENNTYGCFEEW